MPASVVRSEQVETMKIIKPIIIVGTGRCGSTIFHRLLARHPQLMWMSGFCYRYPDKPTWNRWAVTAMDNPLLHRMFGETVRPGENYRFWDRYAYGFSEPCRDLLASDVSTRVKRDLHSAFEPMLTAKRNRLLIKITGWPRMGVPERGVRGRQVHPHRAGRSRGRRLAAACELLAGLVWSPGLAGRAPVTRGPGDLGVLTGARSWRWPGWSGASRCEPSRPRGGSSIRRATSRSSTSRSATSHSRPTTGCSTSPSCPSRRRSIGTSRTRRSEARAIGGVTTCARPADPPR